MIPADAHHEGFIVAEDREYELHVIFGSISVLPWNWKVWQQIAAELDAVVASVYGEPSTHSRQFKRVGKRLRDIPFGRMTWNEEVHERWTHESPKTSGISGEWQFCDTQVWVPGRAICQRERRRPNVYFQVLNGGLGCDTELLRFGSIFALCIARDLPDTAKFKADEAATSICGILNAKLRVFKNRPWSLPFGPFVKDSLQDLDTWLFRTGPRHTEEPSLALLKEDWQLRPLDKAEN